MARPLKKTVYVGIKITTETEDRLNELIELKQKETGVRLTRTLILEMLINEGLEKYLINK